jgi:hypothetical protein
MRRPADFLIMRHGERQAEVVATVRAFTAPIALEVHRRENPDHRLGFYAVREAKPSAEMLYVLDLASQQGTNIGWVPLVDGKGSQSRTVGRGATIEACRRRGWLDRGGNLTQVGREVRAAERTRLGLD